MTTETPPKTRLEGSPKLGEPALTVANEAAVKPLEVPLNAPNFVPPKLALIAGLIGTLAAPASALLPPPVGPILGLVAIAACFLGGLGLPQLKFTAGNPIVGPTTLPIFGGGAVVAEEFARNLPDENGLAKAITYFLAALFAFLSGKAAPQVKKVEAPK